MGTKIKEKLNLEDFSYLIQRTISICKKFKVKSSDRQRRREFGDHYLRIGQLFTTKPVCRNRRMKFTGNATEERPLIFELVYRLTKWDPP